ncbi:unnamed protein product [Rotaria sp. Silwood1]|nr:unnamed protein product [Rotaria sp. Silwood1]CAF3651032.1 unnamed protein product [Rotaria sp. Silwood1]CAF3662915.1 unnamed protein product [Rotaria sp. Silwood1]CAF3675490.1 unnamed protein product [Rotaria sp. Silwood1]CAF4598529.1 unnamed protein product [Rotaria sp. Silwood1]
MACINSSLSLFMSDFPSYGLIGSVSIGLILYIAYIITFIRNHYLSSSNVYIYFSQLSLLLLLISPITFLFRSSTSINIICSTQTLALQILPFCLLLGFNIHFIYEWLLKIAGPIRKTFLIAISSFLIFFLAILIQTAILLVWFYYNYNYQENLEQCTDECRRPLFLCSLSFNFFLLFLYSFQSSIRYHINNKKNDLIYLLTSLLALCITIIWICFYLFIPLKLSYTFYMNNSYILAYGTLFFVYTFIGPFLYEQLFYHNQTNINNKDHLNNINKMTFKCLSLTKEQQRAFMAAYIKRNLTASCENLTTKNNSSFQQSNQTRHSTLSVESLCPTLISTISYESPQTILPTGINDTSSFGTMASEYLLLTNSSDMK